MFHEAALNKMLANACPLETVGDISVFEFDLHCEIARVHAVLKSTVNEFKYDIINVEII